MRFSGISAQAHSQTKDFSPKKDSDAWNCSSFVLEFAQAVKKCVKKKANRCFLLLVKNVMKMEQSFPEK